jgi:thiamine biosynthesis protein ThiS
MVTLVCMILVINGTEREFPQLMPGNATLAALVNLLELKGDRVAIEHNGAIVPRAGWTSTGLASLDKLEVVHFVGGGRN